MAGVEDRDDSPAPRTDRNPGTLAAEPGRTPGSHVRPTEEAGVTASGARRTSSNPPVGSDTLLSVPAPASRDELALDERLSSLERRLDALQSRLELLERQGRRGSESPERGYWVWLLFLAALALAWQLLSLLR